MFAALQRLGRGVADQQDRSGQELDLERGLAGVRRQMRRESRRWTLRRWAVGLAIVAATMVTLALAFPRFEQAPSPLTFDVGGRQDVVVGKWVQASEVMPVHFSDGTRVATSAAARWRIVRTTPSGANIQLERGRLEADVRSRVDSQWQIEAGPFRIDVTGTNFLVAWDPITSTFELRMREGTIMLTGPVAGNEHEISAPDHIRIDVVDKRLSIINREPVSEPRQSPAPVSATTSTPSVAVSAAPPRVTAATWQQFARRGDHAAALARVRTQESTLLNRASAGDLLLLSNTARLAGRPALAMRALAAIDTRFPDSVERTTARFLFGKMEYDVGRFGAAITKLSAYLDGAPGGAFAAEAEVLRILALHRTGRVDEARRLIRVFLRKRPGDDRAGRLKSILGDEQTP